MSQVKIQGNASGTGIFTVAAPNSNTDRTLTLPDGAGTLDRLERAGNVLQVVNFTTNSTVANSTTTYSDTGLTATITPSSTSSKILIMINQQVSKETGANDTSMMLRILKNGSVLSELGRYIGWTGTNSFGGRATFGWQYLDSPATTSALTYKTQFAIETGISGQVRVQYDGSVSTITLVEIAG